MIAFLVLALLAGPFATAPALADAGHDHDHGGEGSGGFYVPAPGEGHDAARTGASSYSWYGDAWLYGPHTLSLVGGQSVTDFAGDDTWLTWVDASSGDVYAHNLAADSGYYVTDGDGVRARPDVSDGRIVWEERRDSTSRVYVHTLETGATHAIADNETRGRQRNPVVSGSHVAWEEFTDGNWDVIVHDLATGEEVRVSDPDARDTDPAIVDGFVVWRTYRFNVWDVHWFDLTTGERGSATSDRNRVLPPVTDDDAAFFLKTVRPGSGAWMLHRFDPDTKRTTATDIRLPSGTDFTVDGERLVYSRMDPPGTRYFAVNLTTTHTTAVTGYLTTVDLPVLTGRALHTPVENGTRHALLTVDLDRHAFMEPPEIRVQNPSDGALAKAPLRFAGSLLLADGWGEPVAFGYGILGENFTRLEPTRMWTFTVDLSDHDPGSYVVTVEAHFADAPPVVEYVDVTVPRTTPGVDVERAAEGFYSAFMNHQYQRYFGSNPAILGLLGLVLLTAALAGARWWLKSRPRRVVVEYVPPPEEDNW